MLCCAKSLSRVRLFATPWTVACQASLSMGILQARILEWVAIPFSRGSSQPGIEPGSPALQADSLLSDQSHETWGQSSSMAEVVMTRNLLLILTGLLSLES